METVPAPDGVCATCRVTLSSSGDCLACLLRVALYEAVEAIPPQAVAYGDFEISRREDGSLWELGRGAMGVTYRAVDRVLHRNVALKVIDPPAGEDGSEAMRERFLREARAAAALRHANVAGVFQFGVVPEDGRCYYAMELVEGETLAERIRRDGPLPVETVLEIAAQVTGALVEAASRQLVHRDLKPGNIMLGRGDGAASTVGVKVIDFGLAKAAVVPAGETDLTQGGFVGTPAFASPEQFHRGETVDARSDLYALGMTMWYSLTGRLPFSGKTLEEIRDHPGREALPLEQLTVRKVSGPVVALLRSLLAVDPAERPASARELLASLEACRPRPTGGPARQREPGALVGLAILALAITLSAAGGAWWIFSGWSKTRALETALAGSGKSIAVLPFANLSVDKENAFFTDGVQDEILTDLAKVADLKVISRNSVMPYKSGTERDLRAITRELGVSHLVEGSVQRAGNRVHVTARLIDARTFVQLWSEPFDGDLSDVFAIQSKIAQAIVRQLQAKLSPGERAAIDTPPTGDLAAYEAYLHGKKLGRGAELTQDESEIRQAVRQLEEATSRDPQFFLAWCELCRANLSLYWYNRDHTPDRLARAESALRSVRGLRPEAGEAHLAEGLYLHWGQRDFVHAATEFQTAAHLLPNDSEAPFWLGVVLRRQGRWDESLHQAERASDQAIAIDPLNLYYPFWRAACIRMARADLEPMRAWMRSVPVDSERWSDEVALTATYVALEENDYAAAARALSRYHQPTIVDSGYVWPRTELEGWIAILSGDPAVARTALQAARQSAEEALKEHPGDPKAQMVRARIEAELGDKEIAVREGREACALLPVSADAVDGPYILTELAAIYAQTSERDQAIDTLRSIVGRPAGLSYGDLQLDPRWNSLRSDPRFASLAASIAPGPGR